MMKKKKSEGFMIAVTVLFVVIGVVIAWQVLKWVVTFFFPGLF